ncbi:YafY family protein [Paenibacillus sp. YN15]|uniref:helix-turn-helix transcriptional regulator n=1 Tax=Paenibacillus sp. YN15 TaxID=1742774 RepID=UPI000DCAE807|nr:hypothetical protein [Paenibacillus sp. YN15]RAU97097.1 hypothetical protein DQG13_19175 [Paenibacillus sp. YN15]
MSNWHRVIWIDGRLRAEAYPNCQAIAEAFNISLRQAARDVEYLRDSLGAPVEYCRKNKGYHYTEATFALPAMLLTASQARNLSYLSYRYEKTGDPEALGLAELFQKLAAGELRKSEGAEETCGLLDKPIPVHTVQAIETEKFQLLARAIRLQIKVRLDVMEEGEIRRLEHFAPMQLFPYDSENCLLGFDEAAGMIRLMFLRTVANVSLRGERYAISPLMGAGEVVPVAEEEPYCIRKPPVRLGVLKSLKL